jgi:recombinational DNA repair protein RecT
MQVDCLKAKACDGGHEEEVFEAMARKGVVTEQRYPYGNVSVACSSGM